MKRVSLLVASGAILAVLAGCGSSSKTTSTSAAASNAATTNTTSTSNAATTSGGSPYSKSASTTSSTAPAAVVITTKHTKYGTVLASGSKKATVYLFEGDKGSSSSCTGACAAAWPPVTGQPSASGSASSAHVGVITRSDGTKQVTYNGHPLYTFATDKDSGDAYGEGIKAFGADWYVVSPSGNKVDES